MFKKELWWVCVGEGGGGMVPLSILSGLDKLSEFQENTGDFFMVNDLETFSVNW